MIKVLRLNHRRERDKRITTHVALASRALGADEFILAGDNDSNVLENIRGVVDRFGGDFQAYHSTSWKKEIEEFSGVVVHLTMYGERIQDVIETIRVKKDIMLVVGGAKVPSEVYDLSDYNVAVTNQPHSEVSSVAIFLDHYHLSKELGVKFSGGEMKINPSKSGKDVVNL